MARKHNGPVDLTTKTARARLPAKDTIYRHALGKGRHLGYRKRKATVAGLWLLCETVVGEAKHRPRALGASADDFEEANGTTILNFFQAQQKAIAMATAKRPEKTPEGPLTVERAMADYVDFLRTERKTADDAEVRIRKHVLPELGKLRVEDLTTDRLTRWHRKLVAEPALLSKATANRELTNLKAGLNYAFEHGRVHDDLSWRRVKPFKGVDVARQDALSPAEVTRLINASDPASGFRNVLRALVVSGCRYGEICALRVGDFQRGRIVIRTSKSGKPRDVRLTDDAVAFFTQLTAGRPSGETMLLRGADGKPWGKSHQARLMRAACKAARITPAVGVHALRHTWASQAVMGGMPLMLVAENLGHSGTKMVEKHYAHLVEDYRDEMFAKFAPRLGTTDETNVVTLKEKA